MKRPLRFHSHCCQQIAKETSMAFRLTPCFDNYMPPHAFRQEEYGFMKTAGDCLKDSRRISENPRSFAHKKSICHTGALTNGNVRINRMDRPSLLIAADFLAFSIEVGSRLSFRIFDSADAVFVVDRGSHHILICFH